MKQSIPIPASATEQVLELTLPDSVPFKILGTTPGDVNNPPKANAGGDQSLTLPLSSFQLNGAATDSDGTISDVTWRQVTGPVCTIENPKSLITKVNGVIEGNYSFGLVVIDDKGLSGSDEVTIKVSSAPTGYTQVYQNGFDTKNDLDPFDHGQIGNGSLSTTIKKDGAGSFKSVPANVSSGIRSEVQFDSGQSPKEGMIEYDVYYENFFANSGHSLQWHPSTGGGSGTGLYHKGGKLQFVTVKSGTSGTNVGTAFSVSTKEWHHMKLEYKFGSGGYIRVYMDGVERVNANVQIGDGSSPYLKVGVNMWENQTSVVYYDNLKVYKK